MKAMSGMKKVGLRKLRLEQEKVSEDACVQTEADEMQTRCRQELDGWQDEGKKKQQKARNDGQTMQCCMDQAAANKIKLLEGLI